MNYVNKKEVVNKKGEKKIIYGREYPWGFADCLSNKNSDFNRLYKLILSKDYSILQIL
jgi:septin family protein